MNQLGRAVAAVDASETADELEESATTIWTTVAESLPRVAVALVVLVVFVAAGRLLRPLLRRRLCRERTPSFARVFSRLTSSAATLTGALLALTIVFPSVRPVDVLAGAGIVSVGVGFAFQDILQNLLAGVLLLFRQPFKGGDQIEVGDVVGTVEEINIRETVVRTFDGRRVLVPNAKVYTDVILVQTAQPVMRSSFTVGIAYESDVAHAAAIAREAVSKVTGVADAPAPEVLVVELGASTVDLEVLVWCSSRQLEMRRVLSDAMTAVKGSFDEHGVEMPSQIVALQSTSSFAAALHGGNVTPGGSVAA